MLEIVLTVCAIAAPSPCHDERFKVLDEDITLMQCMMNPGVIIPGMVQWTAEHPGWRVSAWTCREYRHEKDT